MHMYHSANTSKMTKYYKPEIDVCTVCLIVGRMTQQVLPSLVGPQVLGADLSFKAEIMDSGLVHHVVWLFTSQLSLVSLSDPGGMAR